MYPEYQDDIDVLGQHSFLKDFKKKRYRKDLLDDAVHTFMFLAFISAVPEQPMENFPALFVLSLYISDAFASMVKNKNVFTLHPSSSAYAEIAIRLARYILYTEWETIARRVRRTKPSAPQAPQLQRSVPKG